MKKKKIAPNWLINGYKISPCAIHRSRGINSKANLKISICNTTYRGRVQFIRDECVRSSERSTACVSALMINHRTSTQFIKTLVRPPLSRLPRRAEEVPRYNRAVFALRAPANKSRMTGIRLRFRWHLPTASSRFRSLGIINEPRIRTYVRTHARSVR